MMDGDQVQSASSPGATPASHDAAPSVLRGTYSTFKIECCRFGAAFRQEIFSGACDAGASIPCNLDAPLRMMHVLHVLHTRYLCAAIAACCISLYANS